VIVHPQIEQGSPEWFAIRAGMLTASKFDKILTPGGARSRQIDDCINDLIGQSFAPDELEEFAGNWHTKRGKEMEPQAREAFVARTGHAVEEVGFCATDDLIAGCSPDGLITCDGQYVGGLEIKCPSRGVHVRYVCAGVLPEAYKQQVHGSLVVTGLPEWHFWSWHPRMEPLHVIVRPDGYTRAMAEALREFSRLYTDAWRFAEPKLTPKQ
jgi:hypothetical protein